MKSIINVFLFGLDPMNTGCYENRCFNEYEDVAELILSNGVKSAFFTMFWEKCINEEQIENIEAAVKNFT